MVALDLSFCVNASYTASDTNAYSRGIGSPRLRRAYLPRDFRLQYLQMGPHSPLFSPSLSSQEALLHILP